MKKYTQITYDLMSEFKKVGLEAEDAAGIMCFLNRDESYKQDMFEFIQNDLNRDYKAIMHHLVVILGHAEV